MSKRMSAVLIPLLILAVSCVTQAPPAGEKPTGNYDIGKIPARTDDKVLLYMAEGFPVGTSSFTSNNPFGAVIKSDDGSDFRIVAFEATCLVEAVTARNETHAFMATRFSVSKEGLTAINKEIRKGSIPFQRVLDVGEAYVISGPIDGTQESPDPKDFSVLRLANAYNITVTDAEGKTYILQVCYEEFVDASEL